MRQGIIKINPFHFTPVVVWENGRIDWRGTKKERPSTTSFYITEKQQAKSFKFINEKVYFEFDKYDHAIIFINGKKI